MVRQQKSATLAPQTANHPKQTALQHNRFAEMVCVVERKVGREPPERLQPKATESQFLVIIATVPDALTCELRWAGIFAPC